MENVCFWLSLAIALLMFTIAYKKDNKFFLFLGIVIISVVSGFRGIDVGIDTKHYYNAFVNNFPVSWQFEETGFRIISTFLMKIFKNASFVFLTYSIVTNSLIISRLWDFRKKCNFLVMVFLYLTIYFIDSMNIMRQFIAMSIIFYSTKLLENKKYFPFIIITILCTFIHKTSLLALLFVVVYFWNNLTKRQKLVLIIPIAIISVIGVKYVMDFESGHIDNYFGTDNSVSNFNFTFLYRTFIFVISYILVKSDKKITISKRITNNKEEVKWKKQDFQIISFIYFFGLCFGSMGMFYFVMTRMGYYYLIFELVYWGYITKNSKNNGLNFSMIAIYAIYIIFIEATRNGSGIFPFYFSI